MLDAQLVVLVDEDLGEERLVAQAPVGVVAAGVDVGAVGEQAEGVVEVGSGVGVVRLHEPVLLAFEPIAVGAEAFQFLGFSGHEPVELMMEHPCEGILLGRRDLDAGVVLLDELLEVFDEHRLARAVGALGVPTGAHEVAVHVPMAVLRVGDDESGTALPAMDGALEVVAVNSGRLDGTLIRGQH